MTEKVLTYEEYVKVKNLLTKIKGQLDHIDKSKEEVINTVNQINDILDMVT